MAARNLPEEEYTFSISAFPVRMIPSSLRNAPVIYGLASRAISFDKSNSVRGTVFTPRASNSDGCIPSQRTFEQAKFFLSLDNAAEPKLV